MKNVLEYKDYFGSVEYSGDDNVFYGKILGIKALVLFEGQSVDELKSAFYEAVDDYINTCKEMKLELEKPFKGSLNIRIGRDLHQKAAIAAEQNKTSINQVIKEAIDKYVA
ncbi:MAG: type II toxin-antitoxin system HicB family antitoxin [Candidatus Gastranaerophilaceae bacterium]